MEIKKIENVLVKIQFAIDTKKYGEFREFIDGDEYYILKEGYFVPLNFIDDQLVYFLADNNKIYGHNGTSMMYEYHFSELYKKVGKSGDKTVLKGLKETLITTRNFELIGTIKLRDPLYILKDKLYFIDNEKIRIVDLNNIK